MTSSRQLSRETYARAERFLAPNARHLVFQLGVVPHWIGDGDRFWYRNETAHGVAFVLVDPEQGERRPAFDHAKLVAALSVSTGKPFRAEQLPFDAIDVDDDERTIRFDIDGQRWSWGDDRDALQRAGDQTGEPENEVPSPDGQWRAFVRDHDLFVRAADGREIRLTDDGEADNDYATPLPSPLPGAGIRSNRPTSSGPAICWSPDSTRLITHRIDSRDAGRFHLVQSVPLDGSLRPALHSYVYPLPGDDNTPMVELIVFDLEQRKRVPVSGVTMPLLYYGTPLRPETVWWSEDGRELYLLTRERGYRSYTLWSVDAETGESHGLISEESETAIEPSIAHGSGQNIRVIHHGTHILWYSQRDGWGHLYLYDRDSGQLIRQLTSGPWAVVDVKQVDEAGGWISFTAVGREAGRDPYFQHLYRARLDADEDPELLTPEDATHEVSFSPSGHSFVDVYSRVDQAPVAVLRTADGNQTLELERADISPLLATGWRPPERFAFKARDGVTDVYGVLVLPTHFDSSGKLPVIDDIYAGPQTNRAPVSFGGSGSTAAGLNAGYWHAQALAELGFAVVTIDGLGMPYRAKAFHDRSYKDLGDAGLAEHIIGIRHLAERYPFLDLERVGIFGHSAGGYSSAHAILKYPDFYKVAVSSAGNHDHRLDKATWVERYMGLPVGEHYAEQANSTLAANLRGKLFLIHGEMDENVHPSSTMRLVQSLIEANKDFDMFIYPNQPHGVSGDPYFLRRRWDYFVRHLLGAEPPADYQLMGPVD